MALRAVCLGGFDFDPDFDPDFLNFRNRFNIEHSTRIFELRTEKRRRFPDTLHPTPDTDDDLSAVSLALGVDRLRHGGALLGCPFHSACV
jgi:hypothetical protein